MYSIMYKNQKSDTKHIYYSVLQIRESGVISPKQALKFGYS